jgi:hypothetical protein
MPNATVRASAQALPEETNRRAVLGAVLAAATAAAALPALAAASIARSHHPDADLFALIERARTADALADEASMAADDVLFKIAPSFPQALIWTDADTPHWYGLRAGERISNRDIDFLRDWLKLPERPDRPWPQDICRSPLIPLRAFAERAREIVRAKDEFEASWQAAGEHPDVLEAAARREALSERWSELAMRVATTPAKTMEGLIAKIALIASGYTEDDLDGTYDGILASAALDAQGQHFALQRGLKGELRT